MIPQYAKTLVIALFGAVSLVACSSDSATAPNAVGGLSGQTPRADKAVLGSYHLSFLNTSLDSVASLTVCSQVSCDELILKAHVDDGAGSPAQSGSVTFQYCSLKGFPPNDITRADEAPSSACTTGAGKWANLATLPVDVSGNAYLDFGIVLIPRTIGFRFRYTGQRSGIANGTSDPRDFTWVSAQ